MDEQRKKLIKNSQSLRKEMTKEERHLWYDYLKKSPFKVHRQYVVGNYILDFYIPCAKICIEIDGEQHYKSAVKEYDTERTEWLSSQGITMIRYDNRDINQRFRAVCDSLSRILEKYN